MTSKEAILKAKEIIKNNSGLSEEECGALNVLINEVENSNSYQIINFEVPKTMDICTKSGEKVIFQYPESGYGHDQEKANKFLKVGNIYHVKETIVGGWCTSVILEEFPDEEFNSVQFINYEEEVK